MEEKGKIIYLAELEKSKETLLAVLDEVSDADFQRKIDPDTWAIAEVVEHIIKVESAIVANLKKLIAEKPNVQVEKGLSDEEVMKKSSQTLLKVKSAPIFIPSGIFEQKEDAISSFKKARLDTTEFLSSTQEDLSKVVFPHFRLGLLNGNNWLLFIAGHCIRHTTQINNIRKKLA